MSYPVEMYTDLMGSTGLQTALHYSHISEALKDTIMSHCMLAMISFREHLEAHPVVRVTTYIASDGSLIFLEVAPDDSDVTALYRVYKELLCKIKLRFFILGNYKKTRSILIYTMHQYSHPLILSIRSLRQTKMMCQSIYQRAAEVAVTGMHYHARFLVEHQHILVFMHDIQWDILR